jgi:hypothetical protein
MTIWHGGKTYPVDVVPLTPGPRKISGVSVEAQGYTVRAARVEGQERFRQTFSLYFARDDAATPVEIVGKRGWVRLRMQLVDPERLEPAGVAGR